METKHGKIPSSTMKKYRKSMIDKIWLLIPLKEEGCSTLQSYIERTNRELCGLLNSIVTKDEYLVTAMFLLENLIFEEDIEVYKHDVFRCIELIKEAFGGVMDDV